MIFDQVEILKINIVGTYMIFPNKKKQKNKTQELLWQINIVLLSEKFQFGYINQHPTVLSII